MKILIVKLNYIESASSCNVMALGLIEGLHSLGNEITIVSIKKNENMLSNNLLDKNKYKLVLLGESKYLNLTKSNKKTMKQKITLFCKKIIKKLFIYDHTYKTAKNLKIDDFKDEYYDLVISISDSKTSHIGAKTLIKQGLKYDKWIQYWGDPLALDITRQTIYPKCILKHFEKKLISDSDYVFYVSPLTYEANKKIYKKLSNKFRFAPTPYVSERYISTANNKYVIGYYGDYTYRVRNIKPLYNACLNLDDSIELKIIGDGDVKLNSTTNIKVLGRCNVYEHEMNTDLFICLLNKKGTQIPGKLFYCAATNKPVLIILDGEYQSVIKEYFEKYDRFVFCENNEESIKNAIKTIMSSNKLYEPLDAFSSIKVASSFLSQIYE